MLDKNPTIIRAKRQVANSKVRQGSQELCWFKKLNFYTRRNRREAAHIEEKALLKEELSRSQRRNARQRQQAAEQRSFARRYYLGVGTVRHLAMLLILAMVLLNDLADMVLCIPAIGVMLFVIGFDAARIWVEFKSWLAISKKRKSGGK